MFKPELLSPAGTLKNMRYAFTLMAQMLFMRASRVTPCACATTNSTTKISSSASMKPTRWGKSFMSWSNIAPHNAKLKTFIRDLKPVVEM